MSLFSFLIGGVVGGLIVHYFLRQPKEQEAEQPTQEEFGSTEQARDLKSQLEQKEEQLKTCKTQLKTKTEKLQQVTEQLTAAKAQISDLRKQGASVESKPAAPKPAKEKAPPAEPDDLSKIQGIGPKTAELLKEKGILTFAQLAETDVSRLRAILEEAGSTFKRMNPESWPEKAKLAAKG